MLNAAALDFETSPTPSSDRGPMRTRPPLTADNGTTTEPPESEQETCPNGDPTCPGPDAEADADTLPCFACYRTMEAA